jgi:hypothetical protein
VGGGSPEAPGLERKDWGWKVGLVVATVCGWRAVGTPSNGARMIMRMEGERGETVGRRQLGRLGSDSSFAEPRRLLTGQDWGDPWLVVEEGM